MILNKDEIRKLILENGLITDYIDLKIQLTENGFDLTLRELSKFITYGMVDFDNSNRKIPETESLELDNKYAQWLEQGVYKVTFNETLKIPLNLCAESIHRSSLMRCGVVVSSGYWESGYSGRGVGFLNVINPHGFMIFKNARIAQIRFKKNNPVDRGYNGKYQNEGKNK